MVSKRWSQIERLYHAARELRAEERTAFLISACGADGNLKREVESLLANDREEDRFLETPALQAVSGVLEQVVTTQTQSSAEKELVGETISHYRIVAELGRGGMGVVYKAEDTLLGRPVALKFLRRELGGAASSPLGSPAQENALERFRREARAASALNHPNICIVHDVGWHEGAPFMVLEYLEGRTLREAIETGPLESSAVIDLGIQIADALAAAHGKGIIHRDIKPTNILVTPAGQAKVLDFGLAKPQPKDPQSPAAGTSLTNPGIAVGTVAYMSPEQARGEEVDARSDLFSLGIVLYEAAAGHRPFGGDSGIATLHQIVAEQPKPMRDWNPQAPPELERIVAKALEKDRELRFQSAAELRSDLMRLKRGSLPDRRPLAKSSKTLRRWLLAFAAAVSLGVAGWILLRPPKPPEIVQYKQLTNDGVMKQLVATDGVRLYLNESSGAAHWTAEMTVNGGEPSRLPMMSPEFALLDVSPDGTSLLAAEISSYDRQLLWIVPVLGAPPYRLGNLEGSSGAWSPDGQQIAYSKGGELFLAKKDGSGVRKLCEVPGAVTAPAWAPDGKRIRFTLADEAHHSEAIWEVTSEGKNTHLVFPSHGPSNACCGRWTPDSRNFVFSQLGQIWILPEARGIGRGAPHAVQLTAGATAFAAPLPSKDGTRLFAGGYTPRGEAIRYDKWRNSFVPLLQGISADFVTFSKSGRWIAYVTFPDGVLWRSRVDYGERVQLTQPAPYSYALVPRWSPDGARIAYGMVAPGKLPRIYIVSFAGGRPEELALPNEAVMDPNWSPDGKRICYGGTSATAGRRAGPNIHIVDLESHRITDIPGSENYFSPRWSPDGRYLAALSVDASRLGLFDFSTGTWHDIETGSFLSFPYWSHDGQFIYHIQGSKNPAVMRIPLNGRQCQPVLDLRDVRLAGFYSFSLSLTPADEPVLVLDRGSEEVFALQLKTQ
ncbi:MAG TPA: protein kinase [Bryobacteraceae bacterium]|nr:protein kinase [Bryobacteraceae bacterium]